MIGQGACTSLHHQAEYQEAMNAKKKVSSRGVIASRKCPLCGHHEVGYTTEEGIFHPLRPGTIIEVVDSAQTSFISEEDGAHAKGVEQEEQPDRSQYKVWIPGPLKGDKRCRLKYGVILKEASFSERVSGQVYRLAYLEKLERLIEKEIHVPIAVILDRFFTASHLASGNPRQIAEALWRELDEIRRPAQLVSEWLKREDELSLNKMIHPANMKQIGHQPAGETESLKELEELSLEEFLALL